MSRWTKLIFSILVLAVPTGTWVGTHYGTAKQTADAPTSTTAKAVLTVAGTENPLPKKVPFGVQVSATVANKRSVVGEGKDAVAFKVLPAEIGQWAQVSQDGKTVQVSTGMVKKLVTIHVAVAKGDTVSTGTTVVSVEPDGSTPVPTPEPDVKPDTPDTPVEPDKPDVPAPGPTDPSTEIYRLLASHIKLNDDLRKESSAISNNFSDVATLVSRAMAGDPEAAAYTNPATIIQAVVTKNQTSVKDRSVWIEAMTALKQYTDELIGKTPSAADYAELYPNVAKAFDLLSKPASAQEKY
jgi:hypothetical protein